MGLADIMPTVLGLLGEEAPGHVQGRDLSPILRGEVACLPGEEHAIVETGDGAGIRTPTHLYGLPFVPGTRNLGEAPRYLWDVSRDPYELDNLAGTAAQSATARELDSRLRDWDARTPWLQES
jgi:arylsulfatase A-like enzyme